MRAARPVLGKNRSDQFEVAHGYGVQHHGVLLFVITRSIDVSERGGWALALGRCLAQIVQQGSGGPDGLAMSRQAQPFQFLDSELLVQHALAVLAAENPFFQALVNSKAAPDTDDPQAKLPDYFITVDHINPREHVDVQAAAQKWVDSSISKTANVPTDYPYEDFKDIYMYAFDRGLKGCTTFRFNPQAFQGVLVKDKDLENTTYRFQLANGEMIEVRGNEEIEYDGEVHSAANLYDALKEGYYGRF